MEEWIEEWKLREKKIKELQEKLERGEKIEVAGVRAVDIEYIHGALRGGIFLPNDIEFPFPPDLELKSVEATSPDYVKIQPSTKDAPTEVILKYYKPAVTWIEKTEYGPVLKLEREQKKLEDAV